MQTHIGKVRVLLHPVTWQRLWLQGSEDSESLPPEILGDCESLSCERDRAVQTLDLLEAS